MRHNNLLNVPFVMSQQSRSNIVYHGAVLGNNLPEKIRKITTVSSFK